MFVLSYERREAEPERLNGCLYHLNFCFVWRCITTIINRSVTMILYGEAESI